MAACGLLPVYNRYLKFNGTSPTGRYFRSKIKYFLVFVFLIFGAGVMFSARNLRTDDILPTFSIVTEVPPASDLGQNQTAVPLDSLEGKVSFILPIVNNLTNIVAPPPAVRFPVVQGGEDPDPKVQEKRNQVKAMMKHAWDGYVQWAGGKNELRPLSKRPYSGSVFGDAPLGVTIVDSLDTLLIMGLDEEYKQGRQWVVSYFDVDNVNMALSVFETNIRLVGGLISCYALTGDTLLRDLAETVVKKLLPAFRTPTGIPNALVHFRTGRSHNYNWAYDSSILSEFGSLHLEFLYLSDITGNTIYREKVDTIRKLLQKINKPQGLYPNYLDPQTGHWRDMYMVSIGALGDSFYEYLLKAWLQSGREDTVAKSMFTDAMDAIIRRLLRKSPGGLMYFAELNDDNLNDKMGHLACFSGGLFGLAARVLNDTHSTRYMEVAEGITHTCHESYDRSRTKLGPENFEFFGNIEAKAISTSDKYYILRPEVIESYFIMWRLTKKQKYRDWAWEAVKAIEKYCRTPGGYSGIDDVYSEDPVQDDVQQSFFLAETLKYLYLIFSDDSLISLEEWVLNTEAHPLPIKNANPLYRPKKFNGF